MKKFTRAELDGAFEQLSEVRIERPPDPLSGYVDSIPLVEIDWNGDIYAIGGCEPFTSRDEIYDVLKQNGLAE